MNKKQKPYTLKEFLDYIHQRMHPHKRHAFEKQMQKDPFMQDAMEGLALNSSEEATKRIQKLNDAILKKPQTRNSFYVGRIAAGLALLITAGGILLYYFWFTGLNSTEQLALEQHPIKNESTEDIHISPSTPLESLHADQETETKESIPSTHSLPKAIQAPQEDRQHASQKKPDISADIIETDNIKIAEAILRKNRQIQDSLDKYPFSNGMFDHTASGGWATPIDFLTVRGVVVFAEDQSPIPGAQITIPNTSFSTYTNDKGKFEITIPNGTDLQLQASFLGMQTTLFNPGVNGETKVVMQSNLAALDEVVVTESSPLRSAKRTLNAAREGIKSLSEEPEPVIGHKAFKEYLEKNAFLPEGSEKASATVTLSLRFNKAGLPVHFEVISSPGEIYTHTAIKVIEKGGIWHIPNQSRNIEDYPAVVKVVLRKRK